MGYIIDEERKLKLSKNVTMVTPKRKNQKKRSTILEKSKLKNRFKIEFLFSKVKIFNRIHVRRDSLMITYMGFFTLACIFMI